MKKDLRSILQRPLIIGASVSGDYLTPSPGRVLSERFTAKENIRVNAGNGRRGADVLNSITDADLADRSVVIGLDLFFWDSFNLSPSITLSRLEQFVARLDRLGIPFVIGEIPEFTADFQMSIGSLNKAIHRLCEDNPNCYLLPLNHILLETIDNGFIIQNGRRYQLSELLPDGLHIGKVASEYLADQISKSLDSKTPKADVIHLGAPEIN